MTIRGVAVHRPLPTRRFRTSTRLPPSRRCGSCRRSPDTGRRGSRRAMRPAGRGRATPSRHRAARRGGRGSRRRRRRWCARSRRRGRTDGSAGEVEEGCSRLDVLAGADRDGAARVAQHLRVRIAARQLDARRRGAAVAAVRRVVVERGARGRARFAQRDAAEPVVGIDRHAGAELSLGGRDRAQQERCEREGPAAPQQPASHVNAALPIPSPGPRRSRRRRRHGRGPGSRRRRPCRRPGRRARRRPACRSARSVLAAP